MWMGSSRCGFSLPFCWILRDTSFLASKSCNSSFASSMWWNERVSLGSPCFASQHHNRFFQGRGRGREKEWQNHNRSRGINRTQKITNWIGKHMIFPVAASCTSLFSVFPSILRRKIVISLKRRYTIWTEMSDNWDLIVASQHAISEEHWVIYTIYWCISQCKSLSNFFWVSYYKAHILVWKALLRISFRKLAYPVQTLLKLHCCRRFVWAARAFFFS